MAISGLVVTVSDDGSAAAALEILSNDPRLVVGERFGRRVAVVAETPGVAADRELWDELRTTPGITHVDVTFVHLDRDVEVSGGATGRLVENQHVDP
jgi:hypothetical protein